MAFTKLQRDVADIYEQVVSMATRHEPHACADPNPNPIQGVARASEAEMGRRASTIRLIMSICASILTWC